MLNAVFSCICRFCKGEIDFTANDFLLDATGNLSPMQVVAQFQILTRCR